MSETDTVHPWPLPVGHRYGPPGYDLRNHDGRTSVVESSALRAWQLAYRHRIKRQDFLFGYWCSVTQTAALDVQRLAGLPRLGCIDRDTYEAVWTVTKPKVEPPAKPQPTKGQLRLRAKKQKDYWRRVSNDVTFTVDGSQPPWWPGRPFGPGDQGWHVEALQDAIQARKTGVYNRETASRVRALRRLHGLPVSDLVDLALAVAIDPGPWT